MSYLRPEPFPPETRHLTAVDTRGRFPVTVIGEQVWDGVVAPFVWYQRPGAHVSAMTFANYHLEDLRAA